jgi:hypothetical protein
MRTAAAVVVVALCALPICSPGAPASAGKDGRPNILVVHDG